MGVVGGGGVMLVVSVVLTVVVFVCTGRGGYHGDGSGGYVAAGSGSNEPVSQSNTGALLTPESNNSILYTQ